MKSTVLVKSNKTGVKKLTTVGSTIPVPGAKKKVLKKRLSSLTAAVYKKDVKVVETSLQAPTGATLHIREKVHGVDEFNDMEEFIYRLNGAAGTVAFSTYVDGHKSEATHNSCHGALHAAHSNRMKRGIALQFKGAMPSAEPFGLWMLERNGPFKELFKHDDCCFFRNAKGHIVGIFIGPQAVNAVPFAVLFSFFIQTRYPHDNGSCCKVWDRLVNEFKMDRTYAFFMSRHLSMTADNKFTVSGSTWNGSHCAFNEGAVYWDNSGRQLTRKGVIDVRGFGRGIFKPSGTTDTTDPEAYTNADWISSKPWNRAVPGADASKLMMGSFAWSMYTTAEQAGQFGSVIQKIKDENVPKLIQDFTTFIDKRY